MNYFIHLAAGESYEATVQLRNDEAPSVRKCYPAMSHAQGDVVRMRDCILLKSGTRPKDLPFVAKVSALWENADDGEMMMSLLWYYRPEHTEAGRRPPDLDDEIFASKHRDVCSVACIEDKCYVLTFNEYCRYYTVAPLHRCHVVFIFLSHRLHFFIFLTNLKKKSIEIDLFLIMERVVVKFRPKTALKLL